MLTTKISPVKEVDTTQLRYRANGRVCRVFDTNNQGELIPVAYQFLGGSDFWLEFAPHGKIYAEVTN